MIPLKSEFEARILEYPQLLPDMAVTRFVSDSEFQYIYLGSNIVTRRDQDQTKKNFEESYAPKVQEILSSWIKAGLEKPFLAYWTDKTELPSGTICSNSSLSVILADEENLPTCNATVSVMDEAYSREFIRGGYLIGSAGLEVTPIDIGYGVPDLVSSLN